MDNYIKIIIIVVLCLIILSYLFSQNEKIILVPENFNEEDDLKNGYILGMDYDCVQNMDIPTEFGYGGYKMEPGKFLDEATYYQF